MSIDLSAPPVPFSFEVYPPRSECRRSLALHETIRRLASVNPRFISVTYGGAGSAGGRSLELLPHILREAHVSPLAPPHLCGKHLRRCQHAHPGVPGCRYHELPRPPVAIRPPGCGRG